MADAVGNKAAKDYHIGTPTPDQGFFAKGLGHTDWGMKNRISRLFSPETGNTVMLAFDHGYIMGSTAGLERLDVSIAPLCEYADVLMGTRGAIRSCIPPTTGKAVCLRATHDSSVLFEDMSQGSGLALDMEAFKRAAKLCNIDDAAEIHVRRIFKKNAIADMKNVTFQGMADRAAKKRRKHGASYNNQSQQACNSPFQGNMEFCHAEQNVSCRAKYHSEHKNVQLHCKRYSSGLFMHRRSSNPIQLTQAGFLNQVICRFA